jgi:penicillin-binding protein 1A
VAARVWQEILGPDLSLKYLDKVNINRDDERYLSLALGGPREGVNTLQLAAAYVPFMSKGIYHEPITYTKVLDMNGNVIIEKKPENRIVYDEAAAYIMVDMMKEVVISGTASDIGRLQGGKMPTAGKTGTTGNNFDKWFVGFTPYYVAAAWYGYDYNVSISSDEQSRVRKIWKAVMDKAHEGLEPIEFPVPEDGLVKKRICVYSGKLATDLCSHDPRGSAVREEYFLRGTEPWDECDVHVSVQICKDCTDESGNCKLAGPYCPEDSKEEKVFIKRPVPYVPTKPGEQAPSDIKYEAPKETCDTHEYDASETNNDVPYDKTLLPPSTNNDHDETLFPWFFNRDRDGHR